MFTGGPLLILNGPTQRRSASRGFGVFRPRLSGERHHRPGDKAHHDEFGGRTSGPSRMSTFGSRRNSPTASVRTRSKALGAAAGRFRLRRGCRRAHGLQRRGASHGHGRREREARRHSHHPGEHDVRDGRHDGIYTDELGHRRRPRSRRHSRAGGPEPSGRERRTLRAGENARGRPQKGGRYRGRELSRWPDWVDHEDDDFPVPMVHEPEDILLIVAGGIPGRLVSSSRAGNTSSQAITQAYRTD